MTDDASQIRQWISRFDWWWRYVFSPLECEPDYDYASQLVRRLPRAFSFTTREHGAVTINRTETSKDLVLPTLHVFGTTRRHQELSARYYECFRRLDEDLVKQSPPAWIDLTPHDHSSLEHRWPDPMRPLIHVESLERPDLPSWFTDPLYHCWNLKLNDQTLVKSFQRFIKSQRKAHRILSPKANAGARHRALSWRRIEFWDLRAHSVRLLNNPESSAVSKLLNSFREERKSGPLL